jgi:hypothetical protein
MRVESEGKVAGHRGTGRGGQELGSGQGIKVHKAVSSGISLRSPGYCTKGSLSIPRNVQGRSIHQGTCKMKLWETVASNKYPKLVRSW